MLEKLFGSKTRVQLLQLLLNNPRQPFYLRELARKLKTQLNSVRREVANLEQLGIIQSTEPIKPQNKKIIGSQNRSKKYYLVNTDFILYPELKGLVLKAQLLLERHFVRDIERLAKVKLLILTGIFVGVDGFATDVLLVGSVNKNRLNSIVKRFEKDLNREINYTVMSPQEFRYRQDITDRFLYDILEGKKIVILNTL